MNSAAAAPPPCEESPQPLSKKQVKKLARRSAAREHMKDKKRMKKLEAREARLAHPPPPPEKKPALVHEPAVISRQDRKDALGGSMARAAFCTLVIDLEFEAQMSDTEKRSMILQTAYAYNSNRNAPRPFRLELRGAKSESFLGQGLQKHGAKEWNASLGFLFLNEPGVSGHQKDQYVYLTADSDVVLGVLEHDKVYVVGGLVDRNRHKGITMEKARALGVATARFPLDDFLASSTFSRVLTTNHAVDVLLEFQASGNWNQAFEKCLPKRKLLSDEQGAPTPADAKTRTAVVTGACAARGLAALEMLFRAGWSVLAVDADPGACDALLERCKGWARPAQDCPPVGLLATCVMDTSCRGDTTRLKNVVAARFPGGADLYIISCVPDCIEAASGLVVDLQVTWSLAAKPRFGVLASSATPTVQEREWTGDLAAHYPVRVFDGDLVESDLLRFAGGG
jgi:tRNA (guanine9-N1)-methyltransferase